MSVLSVQHDPAIGREDQPEPVVAVDGLVKRFDDVEAVRGVSFTVAPGEAFGFLGPNGAGKSTMISILCTLLRPSSGSARVAGFDVARDPLAVRRRIGLVCRLGDQIQPDDDRDCEEHHVEAAQGLDQMLLLLDGEGSVRGIAQGCGGGGHETILMVARPDAHAHRRRFGGASLLAGKADSTLQMSKPLVTRAAVANKRC